MAQDKQNFGSEIRRNAGDFLTMYNQGAAMVKAYFDNGFGSGGAKEITDLDLEPVGITAAELTAYITFLQQLDNLFNNGAVTQSQYSVSVNNVAPMSFRG